MSNKRRLLFRILAVAALILIAALMMLVGRGHTVYLDNKTLEYNGSTYEAPYKVTVTVNGEQAAKLYDKERGSATNIGQNFEMTLEVMREKGGSEVVSTHRFKLPYSMDGIVVNIPGVLAGLPEDAWMSEFVSLVPDEPVDEESVPGIDEFDLGEDF
ncbi:MAG: hypothetical protein IKF55_02120 [Oscillospiraceae bacterium]|nr:hypothetical protein [Oscillospiraceae bacterium]